MLRPFAGDRSKREHHGSCTPCAALKGEVVCNDLCCRHFLVTLAQEDLDDGLRVQPPFVDVLRKTPQGNCHYFDEAASACGAHDKRPLPCRLYDCRDDLARAPGLRTFVNRDVAFVPQAPRVCEGCGRELQLLMGCSAACDGHAVCIACGAGYRVTFLYAQLTFTVLFDPQIDASRRRLYLMRSLTHRGRWAEALPLVKGLSDEAPEDVDLRLEHAVILAEAGQRAEARTLLEATASTQAALELAWLDRLDGDLAGAHRRLEQVFLRLPPSSRVRAMVQLGRIAQGLGQLDAAASWFVGALSESRVTHARNDLLKEHVLRLLRGSPEEQAAARSASLQYERSRQRQRSKP